TRVIECAVCGDTRIERDEQLQLVLTSPNGPELSTSSGGGIKIINDDMPRLTMAGVSVPVGTMTVDVAVSVVLAPKPGEPATVSYTTMNGTLDGGTVCTGSIGYI